MAVVALVEISTRGSSGACEDDKGKSTRGGSGAGKEGQHSTEGVVLVETSTRFSNGAGEEDI
jgi:hypothetical protein